jgi:seryl-tRNA synthetase
MSKKTAREYLTKAYRIDHRINSKLEQLESLNALATRATSTLSGMPKSPNRATSTMADVIVKIIDLQEEINHDIDYLVDLKREIMTFIKSIENTEYQTLLEKRYLCFITWEKIAVDMCYSIHHLYKMHNAALDVCSKVLNQDT